MASVCCSIEMEPKTLSEGQLNHAREAAVDIVQKLEPNQASSIFTEGLRPVSSINGIEPLIEKEEGDQVLHIPVEEAMEKANNIIEVPCQCACIPTILESPDQANLREPFSAPF